MLITLLTDFGTADTYVGQMKGVIAGIAPEARVIDLTHHVPPQDVLAAAIDLDAAVDAFREGAIHVAVVDPGVGSERAPVAVRTKRFTLVGPDNGLFTAVLERYPHQQAVTLSNAAYHRRGSAGGAGGVSATFHGRDIFAPAAAHLAAGVPLAELGEPMRELQRLTLPHPRELDGSLELHVLRVDHFGNLITDLTEQALARWHVRTVGKPALSIGSTLIEGVRRTFSDVAEGWPVMYVGSSGRLEVAIRNGNAADSLNCRAGTALRLTAGESLDAGP